MSAIGSLETSLNEIREFRRISEEFLRDIIKNSRRINESINLEFYEQRKNLELFTPKSTFPTTKVFTQSQQLVQIHNENVALLNEYCKNFFELKNEAELELHFSEHLKPRDVDKSIDFYKLCLKLDEDILEFDNKIVIKFNSFAKKLNDTINIEMVKSGLKPTTLKSLKSQIPVIEGTYYNWITFYQNKILEFLKTVFPNNYQNIQFTKDLKTVAELKTIKKGKGIHLVVHSFDEDDDPQVTEVTQDLTKYFHLDQKDE